MLELIGIAFLIFIAAYLIIIIFAALYLDRVILPYVRAEAREGAIAEGYEHAAV